MEAKYKSEIEQLKRMHKDELDQKIVSYETQLRDDQNKHQEKLQIIITEYETRIRVFKS